MPGRYFEGFTVGEVIPHEMRRTVIETDNLMICALAHSRQRRAASPSCWASPG